MGGIQLRDIFLGEVHPRGQVGLQPGQGIFLGVDFLRQCTVQGRIGQRRSLTAIGGDQVHHGFGLGQAQLAVEKSAAGVLTAGRRLRARRKAGFHQPARHRIAAVAGKLHHVLAGVAVGCAEKQGHALIKDVVPFHEMAEQGGVALGRFHALFRVGRAEHPCRHPVALGTGKPHHGNAACARCRCDGCNGRFLHDLPPVPFPCPALFISADTVSFYHESRPNDTVFQRFPGKRLKIRPYFFSVASKRALRKKRKALRISSTHYSSILPKLKSAKSSTRSVRLGATGAALSASRGA